MVQPTFNQQDIYSDDEVSISNLNRQILFEKYDIGKKKVDAIIEHLNNRFAEV